VTPAAQPGLHANFMTTRASTARGQDKQQFQGRVRKWRKQWDATGDSSKCKLLKWLATEEKTGEQPGPRFPNLHPVTFAILESSSLVNDLSFKQSHIMKVAAIADEAQLTDAGHQAIPAQHQQSGMHPSLQSAPATTTNFPGAQIA